MNVLLKEMTKSQDRNRTISFQEKKKTSEIFFSTSKYKRVKEKAKQHHRHSFPLNPFCRFEMEYYMCVCVSM